MTDDTLDGFSEADKEVIEDIIEGDDGFHTEAFVSELPFNGMLVTDENGFTSVETDVSVSIGSEAAEFYVHLWRSDEQGCWFFTVTYGESEFSGVLNFNVIYNAKGEFSFAFVNSNEGTDLESITQSLPYTNFLAMVK